MRAKVDVKLLMYIAGCACISFANWERDLQQNLNSVYRRPQIHRDELLRHSPVPKLVHLHYSSYDQHQAGAAYGNIDFTSLRGTGARPWEIDRPVTNSTGSPTDDEKILRNCTVLRAQLGIQAVRGYLYLVEQRVRDPSRVISTQSSGAFAQILSAGSPSDKVGKLSQFLHENMNFQSSTIIFVEQRVVTIMLCHLLRVTAATSRFSIASFVGTAGHSQHRSDASNVVSNVDQTNTLQDFRSGRSHVLICTSVAEEGLDIPSCNIVIRFDLPQNLKGYIQSRGRARMQASQFVMLIDDHESSSKMQMLQSVEQEMLRLMAIERSDYEDLYRLEHDASAEEGLYYSVASTG